jgi:hypothetical protein
LRLIREGLRMSKLSPAVVFAFVRTERRTTASISARNFHHCRFALQRYEGVVDDDVSCAEVAGAV